MGWKERYEGAKKGLLDDPAICKPNLDLFLEFFDFEEYKLKRTNRLPSLDDACYKTLSGYIHKLRNANAWFNNKPWKNLTKPEIKRVYDDLEEGRIRNRMGAPFADRRSYYNKIFKSKPFELAGKASLAREVIEFYADSPDKEVRFLDEENFMKLVSVISKPDHLFLFWLAWDIGENINSLLRLQRRDFTKQTNPDTKDAEYLVNLPRLILKRSRATRSEPTLYTETVQFGDMVLSDLGDNDIVFSFGYRQALKILKSAVNRSGAKCLPNNDDISWKDFRSGMACHLLKQGWTTDEVNFRLGHKPSSREIDAYVSYLAIDRRKPKKKIYDSSMEMIQNELEEAKRREKLASERLRRQAEDLEETKKDMGELRKEIRTLLASAAKH